MSLKMFLVAYCYVATSRCGFLRSTPSVPLKQYRASSGREIHPDSRMFVSSIQKLVTPNYWGKKFLLIAGMICGDQDLPGKDMTQGDTASIHRHHRGAGPRGPDDLQVLSGNKPHGNQALADSSTAADIGDADGFALGHQGQRYNPRPLSAACPAQAVQGHAVPEGNKPVNVGVLFLEYLDAGIREFLYPAALDAYHVVMVCVQVPVFIELRPAVQAYPIDDTVVDKGRNV